MSNKPAEVFGVRLPDEMVEKIRETAKQQAEDKGVNVFPADVIREAISEYFSHRGDPEISANVNRGGNRRPASVKVNKEKAS